MRILVVGDSYCPSSALRPAFDALDDPYEVDFTDVADVPGWGPRTPSEAGLREQIGTPEQVIAHLHDHEVLVVQGAPITDAVLDAAPRLRLVGVARGGPVNVDLAAATARGLPVVTTPGKNAVAVAELTMALLVSLARRLPEAIRYVEAGGDFGRDNYEGARWFGRELGGATLGLIGYGQVGRRVADLARAFGVRILVFDPFVPAPEIDAPGVQAVSLDELLASSDFVSLHARASAQNAGLIGAAALARMRRGAALINTARDSLVDEDAVYEALRTGRLSGAAFDVVRPPDPGKRHRLLDFPNVVIVAHIAGATHETLARGGQMLVQEIVRLGRGEPLLNVANRAQLAAGAAVGSAAGRGA